MLPSLLIAFIGWRATATGFSDVKHSGHLQFEAKWETMNALLCDVPNRLVTSWQTDQYAYWFIYFMVGLWLLLLITSRDDGEKRPGFPYRLELLFFFATLAIFKLPIYQKKPIDLWMVGGRFVTLAAMLGALLPRGSSPGGAAG